MIATCRGKTMSPYRSWCNRAAQDHAPEARHGGGIGAVDAQRLEIQTENGSHDYFLPTGSFMVGLVPAARTATSD
jgi:hypothetical protein